MFPLRWLVAFNVQEKHRSSSTAMLRLGIYAVYLLSFCFHSNHANEIQFKRKQSFCWTPHLDLGISLVRSVHGQSDRVQSRIDSHCARAPRQSLLSHGLSRKSMRWFFRWVGNNELILAL